MFIYYPFEQIFKVYLNITASLMYFRSINDVVYTD